MEAKWRVSKRFNGGSIVEWMIRVKEGSMGAQ